jgi:hypothetical protein
MECTRYFLHTRDREDRKLIHLEWIQYVAENTEHEEIRTDGRIRRWERIEEAENRWLRIVLLDDGETLHNAFFDRSFREKPDEN